MLYHVISGHVRLCHLIEVMSGSVKLGHVSSGYVRLVHVMLGKVR